MRLRALQLGTTAGTLLFAGCMSFHPIERTPEAMLEEIAPGDTVRVLTRDGETHELLVLRVNSEELRGRLEDERAATLEVRFDRIERIEIERLNVKRTLLRTVVPVLLATAIACAERDCVTRAAVVSTPAPP